MRNVVFTVFHEQSVLCTNIWSHDFILRNVAVFLNGIEKVFNIIYDEELWQ